MEILYKLVRGHEKKGLLSYFILNPPLYEIIKNTDGQHPGTVLIEGQMVVQFKLKA